MPETLPRAFLLTMTNVKQQTKEKGDTDVVLYQERVTQMS